MTTLIPGYTTAFSKPRRGIWIGLPWVATLNWYEVGTRATRDLAGYTARCVITSGDDSGSTGLLTVTTDDGITIGSTSPNITLTLTDTQTAALTATEDSWLWLTLTDGAGDDVGLLYGPCPIRYWGAP